MIQKENDQFFVLKNAWSLFTKREKTRILGVVVIQFMLGLFDLIGISAIALLGALSVRGIESQKPGNTVTRFLRIFHISQISFQEQIVAISLFAASILIGKTLISVFLSRRTLFFLSNRSARLSGDLISRVFNDDFLYIKSFTQQELLFALTAGVNALIVGVLSPAITLFSDTSLLLVLSIGLIFVQWKLTAVCFVLFGLVALILHRILTVRATALGQKDTSLNIDSTNAIVELISTYRENLVQGSLPNKILELKSIRSQLANTTAELSFMPNITKYAMEATLIFSALIVGGFAFLFNDAVHAIAMLVLFLAAGFRIAPAILRIQQGLIQIKGSLASSKPTLKIANSIKKSSRCEISNLHSANSSILNSPIEIEIENLIFSYPGVEQPIFNNLSMTIKSGESIAIVGPSGGGKTTLVDLMLGVLAPEFGSIKLNGMSPTELRWLHPGSIGYVPQNSFLVHGSMRKNIILGLEQSQFSDKQIWETLEKCQLTDFVKNLPRGLDEVIGDSGKQLSGGQKQRLGLARALITKPKLLVLDEATSSLDATIENEIVMMLEQMGQDMTKIVIAHRLATIRKMDRVVYINEGEIKAEGSFEDLRSKIKDFDTQARLLGL